MYNQQHNKKNKHNKKIENKKQSPERKKNKSTIKTREKKKKSHIVYLFSEKNNQTKINIINEK